MRSATAHQIYIDDSRFEIKSAGTDSEAETVLSQELLNWADTIVVMEKHHRSKIRKMSPITYDNKKIVCLYIPDDYEYMQPELINILKYKVENAYNRGLL